jgi:NADPH-dependent glutamate synthase beta subunit-like oxidoreductase/Pyruvate/2-oxoacid:ferredoxin oxidoreductase delta subunit
MRLSYTLREGSIQSRYFCSRYRYRDRNRHRLLTKRSTKADTDSDSDTDTDYRTSHARMRNMSSEEIKQVQISPLRPRYAEKAPPCIFQCPIGTDIRGWITTIAQAEAYNRTNEEALTLAWQKITDFNPFPAVCGRVCPYPCESACNRKSKDGSVAINALERFVGDFGITSGLNLTRLSEEKRPEKIAIIGSGPAGLSCAYQLSRRGYSVTIFEAFSRPGGMLHYGIPKYRLPREILDAEIQRILDLGIELKCGFMVGKDITLEQLRQDYKAIFVGIGAHKGLKLGVPGEDAANVFTGAEFLNRANSEDMIEVGSKVVVIGGGDSAIDAARVCKRLGAEVTILYRRTRAEMPAIAREIDSAMEEGVAIEFLSAPTEVLRENGAARGLKCIRVELGEPDASGRPQPKPVIGSEFEIEASAIIAAISQEPNFGPITELRQNGDRLSADEWGATGKPGIYAGGDDLALALVATAINQGRLAAQAIDAHIRGEELSKPAAHPEATKVIADWHMEAERHERLRLPVEQRDMNAEIESGLQESEVFEEAQRCMSCGMCMDCESCWMYCTNNCFVRLPKGEHYSIKMDLCNGCKKCAEGCPTGYLELI